MPKFLDAPNWYESNGTLAEPMTTNTAQTVTSIKTFKDVNIVFNGGNQQRVLEIGTRNISSGATAYYYSNNSNHYFNHYVVVSGGVLPGTSSDAIYGTTSISRGNYTWYFPSGVGGTFALTSNIHKLNGSTTLGQTFYAPTSGGTSGQILVSNGSSAPTWQTFSTYVTNNKISASNITITSSLGTTNLQTFLTNLMKTFTASGTIITGMTVSGTVTANTFNAT